MLISDQNRLCSRQVHLSVSDFGLGLCFSVFSGQIRVVLL